MLRGRSNGLSGRGYSEVPYYLEVDTSAAPIFICSLTAWMMAVHADRTSSLKPG